MPDKFGTVPQFAGFRRLNRENFGTVLNSFRVNGVEVLQLHTIYATHYSYRNTTLSKRTFFVFISLKTHEKLPVQPTSVFKSFSPVNTNTQNETPRI